MRVLLIDFFQYGSAVAQSPMIPIGLLSLAAVLKQSGHEPEIISFNYLFQTRTIKISMDPDRDYAEMARFLVDKQPSVVGFATVSSSFHNALILSRHVKELDSSIKVIMGGPHASVVAERILTSFPWVDAICAGEAENSIVAVVEGVSGSGLECAAGAVFRCGSEIVRNPQATLITDLDTLPYHDYSLLPYFKDLKEIAFESGRGCPYGCIYCSTSAYWQRSFRVKSPERVCAEIRAILALFPERKPSINFFHDNFTTNRSQTIALCEQLKQLDITWTCNARIDTIDVQLIRTLAEAGCKGVLIGLETGSPRMQKYLHKNLDLSVLDEITDALLVNNIRPVASFIFGFPAEAEEDLAMTLATMTSLLKKGVPTKFFSLCPLVGTKIYDDNKDKLVLRDYYSNVNQFASCGLSQSLIIEHPDIFSHYYTLNGTLADSHFLLDKFVNFIVINFYFLFGATFARLMDVFDGSLFSFYQDFIFCKGERLAECFNNKECVKGTPMADGFWKYMLALLTEYVADRALTDYRFKLIAHELGTEKEWLANYFKSGGN